jgi:hypothetical protein
MGIRRRIGDVLDTNELLTLRTNEASSGITGMLTARDLERGVSI